MSGDQPKFKEATPELRSDDDNHPDAAAPVAFTRNPCDSGESHASTENRVGNYVLEQLIAHG
jgi:hypothetical protein